MVRSESDWLVVFGEVQNHDSISNEFLPNRFVFGVYSRSSDRKQKSLNIGIDGDRRW